MSLTHFRTMARYNVWMNGKVYQASRALSDDARKENRGAFFGSLHATLNHILLGDLVWLHRFATAEWDFPALEGLFFEPVQSLSGLDMELHDLPPMSGPVDLREPGRFQGIAV